MPTFYLLLGIVVGAVIVVVAFFIIRALARRRIFDSLQTSLFLIKIPKAQPSDQSHAGGEGGDFKTELAHFEQLLGGL